MKSNSSANGTSKNVYENISGNVLTELQQTKNRQSGIGEKMYYTFLFSLNDLSVSTTNDKFVKKDLAELRKEGKGKYDSLIYKKVNIGMVCKKKIISLPHKFVYSCLILNYFRTYTYLWFNKK